MDEPRPAMPASSTPNDCEKSSEAITGSFLDIQVLPNDESISFVDILKAYMGTYAPDEKPQTLVRKLSKEFSLMTRGVILKAIKLLYDYIEDYRETLHSFKRQKSNDLYPSFPPNKRQKRTTSTESSPTHPDEEVQKNEETLGNSPFDLFVKKVEVVWDRVTYWKDCDETQDPFIIGLCGRVLLKHKETLLDLVGKYPDPSEIPWPNFFCWSRIITPDTVALGHEAIFSAMTGMGAYLFKNNKNDYWMLLRRVNLYITPICEFIIDQSVDPSFGRNRLVLHETAKDPKFEITSKLKTLSQINEAWKGLFILQVEDGRHDCEYHFMNGPWFHTSDIVDRVEEVLSKIQTDPGQNAVTIPKFCYGPVFVMDKDLQKF